MITRRPSDQRGHADYGWLLARYSFSFADYFDPDEMGWGALRVINEDRIQAGAGFATHGHRDMEILTYPLAGQLAHRDSLGHAGVIRRGEIQRMSAGSGIRHSEHNPSETESTHLLQIWIEPSTRNLPPSYEQLAIDPDELGRRFCLLASPDGAEGSTLIGQDARVYARRLIAGESASLPLSPARLAYVHVVAGDLALNDIPFQTGDGARIKDESRLDFVAASDCECLIFDLPPHN